MTLGKQRAKTMNLRLPPNLGPEDKDLSRLSRLWIFLRSYRDDGGRNATLETERTSLESGVIDLSSVWPQQMLRALSFRWFLATGWAPLFLRPYT